MCKFDDYNVAADIILQILHEWKCIVNNDNVPICEQKLVLGQINFVNTKFDFAKL